ncbi:MAG: hypothetical protein HMLKMBBP_00620 [Planctomycetes bacterium]|nr:hypothetical protein [Planctomycetota bacterium]
MVESVPPGNPAIHRRSSVRLVGSVGATLALVLLNRSCWTTGVPEQLTGLGMEVVSTTVGRRVVSAQSGIYFFGGLRQVSRSPSVKSVVFRFNPSSRCWSEVGRLPDEFADGFATALDRAGTDVLCLAKSGSDLVEAAKFSTTDGVWTPFLSLTGPLNVAAVSRRSVDRRDAGFLVLGSDDQRETGGLQIRALLDRPRRWGQFVVPPMPPNALGLISTSLDERVRLLCSADAGLPSRDFIFVGSVERKRYEWVSVEEPSSRSRIVSLCNSDEGAVLISESTDGKHTVVEYGGLGLSLSRAYPSVPGPGVPFAIGRWEGDTLLFSAERPRTGTSASRIVVYRYASAIGVWEEVTDR